VFVLNGYYVWSTLGVVDAFGGTEEL